jgi:hypothetical protein
VASGASANTREFAALVVGSNFTSVTYVVVAEHPPGVQLCTKAIPTNRSPARVRR